jgi:hypothetical protein
MMAMNPTPADPPLVSVLLPCWNAEAVIERALRSVLDDRSVPVEVIVVDDASTDSTVDIVAGVASTDPRVVLLRQDANQGVSAARNRGLEAIRSEWLTLLDADDRFVDGGLATLVRAGEERGALAVVGQQVWTDGRRRWLTDLYDIPDIRTPRRTSLAAAPGLLYFASPHAKLFRRPTFEGLRFEGRVLGDQPWIIRALMRAGPAIEVLGDTVYEWWRPTRAERGRATSITASTRSDGRRGVEAASVAIGALRQVLEEAERTVPDAAGRRQIGITYVERLLRSDLGAHLAGALRRRDPATAELLDAIARFIAEAPPGLVAGSDALARDILAPPLHRWLTLAPPARAAAWSLVETAARVDPRAGERGGSIVARTALRAALRKPRRASRGAVLAAMLGDGLLAGLAGSARCLRRGLAARVRRDR